MATADLGLGITYWIKDKFSSKAKAPARAADNITKSVKRSTSSMKKMQGAMVALAGTAVFMASKRVFGALTNSAATFETGMAEVSTLVDSTQVSMKDLGNIAKATSMKFGIPAVEQAAGLYQAISAGVDTSKTSLTNFMIVANKMALGGVTDIKTAVDGLTTVMNAFSKEGLTAQEISDQMFATMKGGKTTIDELSRFMFQTAPISAAVGIKFSEVNAAIVALTKQGTPTSVAMTQIRSAIVGLTRPSADLNKIFSKTKEKTAEAFIKAHGFKAALIKINVASKGTVGGMTKLLGSSEAASGGLAILSNNSKFFDEALKNIQNSSGSTSEAVKKMQNTHSNRVARMKASLEALKITIGGRLLSAMEPLIKKVSEFIGKMDLWLEKHPKVTKIIAGGIGIITVLGIALGAVAAVMGVITLVSVPVLIVFAKVAAVVAVVVAALVALKPVFMEVWKENQDVVNKLKAAWDGFKTHIWPVIKTIIAAFVKFQVEVVGTVLRTFNKILQFVKPIMSAWWKETKANLQFIIDAWTIFKAAMEPVIKFIVKVFTAFKSGVGSAVTGVIGFIQSLIDKIVVFIDKIPLIKKAFSIIGKVFNFGKKMVSAVSDSIVGEIKEINQAIKDGRGNIHKLAENIRNKNAANTNVANLETLPFSQKLALNQPISFNKQTPDSFLSSDTNSNFDLAATKNPNLQPAVPSVKNEITVPQSKIEVADIILDKQKLGKVVFEMQQLQTVRQN